MSRSASLSCLVLGFAMLWIPVGQHAFLTAHWMKLGTFMAPFLVFVALSSREPGRGVDGALVSLALLIAYIIHQFEEHWVDLTGSVFAFKAFLNGSLVAALGAAEGAEILSDAGIFVINTSLVWLVGVLAIWSAPRHMFPMLCMTSIVLVNAVSHTASAALSGAYNPGLLTSILLFFPLSIAAYLWSVRTGRARWTDVWLSILWGFLGHVVMIAGMILSGWFQVLPEPAYFVVLIAYAASPIALRRPPP
ncbi:MAG: HXXEE domain-containing protein [Pseudomonadota bacterium]